METGKTVAQHTYVHLSALDVLEPERREAVSQAAVLAQVEAGQDFNVVKLGQNGSVSLLDYPGFFEQAFPVLRRYWTVDLAIDTVRFRRYADSLNPPILHRKALTGIFDTRQTKTEAEERLRAWMRLVKETKAEGYDRFMNTLDEKMDLITNYFIKRQNSGFVEGLNHKIRVLLGRCYGIFNRVHLLQRLSLDLGGYEQFA